MNKTILFGALIIAGAFGFFQLTSCTTTIWSTPSYVQAIQACKNIGWKEVQITPTGEKASLLQVKVEVTPEVLAAIEKCVEVVKANYAEKTMKVLP